MASDDGSDYGWDIDLDADVHALLSSVAESTAAAIDQAATTTTVGGSVLGDAVQLASTPPTLVAAPNETLRNDVLSRPLQGGHDGDEVDGDEVDDKIGLDRHVAVQNIQNPLSPGHSRLIASTQSGYPDLSRALARANEGATTSAGQPVIEIGSSQEEQASPSKGRGSQQPAPPPLPDTRSPLARFRTFPRKPLSVSDLTSGAWCEVQYEYTLTRLPGGRRTRTAAMKGGTKVHTRLEEEVHTTVRVDVTTREDFLGLKLWNMVQGLRTLRTTGLARELEIWGVIPGAEGGDGSNGSEADGPQVVNGVIDALSYHNPDPALEELLASDGLSQELAEEAAPAGAPSPQSPSTPRKRGRPKAATPSPQKARITDFFASQAWPRTPPKAAPEAAPTQTPTQPPPRRVYITDIKTRSTDRLPTGVAVRPTKVQLFLYHRFLSDLAAGTLDFGVVFTRYRLNPNTPFSDAFLAQIGAVHDEVFYDTDSDTYAMRDVEASADETVHYKTLQSLVGLLQDEVALTFPRGADSVGSLVAVEYRMRGRPPDDADDDDDDDEYDPDAGRCIGTNVIPVDAGLLERYLAWYMAWWRGQRPAVGVQVEEAGYKCRLCEFADDCEWRIGKAEEHIQRVRARRAAQQ